MQTLEQWREFYDGWASGSALAASTGREVPLETFTKVADQLADWMELSGTERVLDVGCASGTLTSLWSPRAREVVAVDFNGPLLNVAHRRHGRPGLGFLQAEAAKLPFPDASFDRVCCFGVLLSLPDHDYVDRALAEILRVARPGARILLGSLPDVGKKPRFFDLLDAAGPWYRRAIPRQVRWTAKRLLQPDSIPGETRILWFDPTEISARMRKAGWSVELNTDPELEDCPEYRFTMVLSRPTAKQVTG